MISETLKTLREEVGFSQNFVAEELNISPQSISKWERGEALPSIEYLPKLAKLFGVTIDELFDKFPYKETEEDKLFAILKKNSTEKGVKMAKEMLESKPLLSNFIDELNEMLFYKRYLYAHELAEKFHIGLRRSQQVLKDLYDLGVLRMRKGTYYIDKEKIKLIDMLL